MMKFSTIIASALIGASAALTTPAHLTEKRQVTLCPGTDSNAQCCATDVLGLVDLNCANRTYTLLASQVEEQPAC